jgi:hypothetical protein
MNNQFLFTTDNLIINSSSLEDITLSTTEEEEDKLPNTLKLKKIKKSKNNIETNNENNISSLTNQYKLHQPSGTTCISRTDYKTFNLNTQEESNENTQEESNEDTQEESNEDTQEESNEYNTQEETNDDNTQEESNEDTLEETNDDTQEETNDDNTQEESNEDTLEETNDDNTDGLEFNNMNDLMSNFNGIFNMMFNNKNLLDERINFNEIHENVNKMFSGNNDNVEFDMDNILSNINMNDINIGNIMNNIENNDIVEINEKSLKSENSLDDFLEYESDNDNSNELEDFLE